MSGVPIVLGPAALLASRVSMMVVPVIALVRGVVVPGAMMVHWVPQVHVHVIDGECPEHDIEPERAVYAEVDHLGPDVSDPAAASTRHQSAVEASLSSFIAECYREKPDWRYNR
jgi:hypothetical protein